jgi:hypothetical protein
VKPFNFYDLIEACQAAAATTAAACPICTLVERDVRQYLDSLLYEYVMERETHATLRAARGLCATHSALLLEYRASVLGIGILYHAVIDELLTLTSRMSMQPPRSVFGRRHEQQHITTFAEHLNDARLAAAFRASSGLCLAHFRGTVNACPDAACAQTLITMQTAHWQRLKGELDEFIRKYDVNHADETMGAEGDSWKRALTQVAGIAAVLGLRRPD